MKLIGIVLGVAALLGSQSSSAAALGECLQSNFSDRVQIEVTAPDSYQDFDFVKSLIQLPGGALLAANFNPEDQKSQTLFEWASELNGSTTAQVSIEVQTSVGRVAHDYEIELLCEDSKLKLDLNLLVSAVKVLANANLFDDPRQLAAIKVQHDESASKLMLRKKNLQAVFPVLAADALRTQISLTLTGVSAVDGEREAREVVLNLEESIVFQVDGDLNIAPVH